jgi:N6-L-threonylcarbamoyladenine synthase
MKILGIETSCDETAISVVEGEGGLESPFFKVLGSALVSQMKLHAEYGGVYPNLAKREHIKNLPHVLASALKNADMTMEKIDAIAVTVGPGLEPALWTGINFAEELSQKWSLPLIPTNHMEGHIASVLLDSSGINFPAVALLISGGHTELVLLKNWSEKEIVGETKDDAVGEAFDKVARMLGLPYPGGPQISALAEKARNSKIESGPVKLPRPMINSKDLHFSFSGLKTAVLYYIRKIGEVSEDQKIEIAREFEDAVIDVLIEKSREAIAKFNPETFIIGGGVIANNAIREAFASLGEETGVMIKIPPSELTTDNATMIAMAGYLSRLSKTETKFEIKAKGNLRYA